MSALYPIVAGAAQGLKYMMSNREKKQAAQNRYQLEALKNEMWNRRLQEETQQREAMQNRLLEQFRINQEEQTKRDQMKAEVDKIKAANDMEQFKEIKRLQQENINVTKRRLELDKIRASKSTGKGGSGKPPPDNTLKDLMAYRDSLLRDDEPDMEKVKNVDSRIQEYLAAKYKLPLSNKINELTIPGMLQQSYQGNWMNQFMNPFQQQPTKKIENDPLGIR